MPASPETPSAPKAQPSRSRRGRQRPGWRRSSRLATAATPDLAAILALLALALALLIYVASLPATKTAYPLDATSPARFTSFYGLETNADGPFRWAKPEAALTLPVNRPGRYIITLSIQDGAVGQPPRAVTISAKGAEQRIQLDASRRDYTLEVALNPREWADARGAIAVRIAAPTYVPAGDPRPLGVLVGGVRIAPAPAPLAWNLALLPALLPVLALYSFLRRLGLAVRWSAALLAAVLVICGAFALGARETALRIASLPALDVIPFILLLEALIVLPLGARDGALPGLSIGPRAPTAATWQRTAIVAALLLLCYGIFQQAVGWNEASRYDLVRALVADRTTRIDPYADNTGDKATSGGHVYSDKAPGASFLAVPAYTLLRAAATSTGAGEPSPHRAVPLLTFIAAGLPTVALVLLLLHFLRAFVDEGWAVAISLGYGLGTIAWPFATMYFGHAAAACFLFAAFYALWRVRAGGPAWAAALAGFLAGWAVLAEFPAIIGVAALLIYACGASRRAPILMIAGALPPAILLGWYNWASFGSPLALGYANLSNSPFAAGMSQGILGVTFPKFAVLGTLLLDTRGLLRLSPWLIFAPLGLWYIRRAEVRAEILLCLGISAAFLLYNAGYYLPLGGWTPGPRFLIPALPFMAVLAALTPRWLRPLVAIQIAIGIAICGVATVTMPNADEALRDPLRQLWWPRLLAGQLAPSTAQGRWGLDGAATLAVLAIAAVLACAALIVAQRPHPAAQYAGWLLIVPLLLLALGFGFPVVGNTAAVPAAPRWGEYQPGERSTSPVRGM